jgi:hypothetical protein
MAMISDVGHILPNILGDAILELGVVVISSSLSWSSSSLLASCTLTCNNDQTTCSLVKMLLTRQQVTASDVQHSAGHFSISRGKTPLASPGFYLDASACPLYTDKVCMDFTFVQMSLLCYLPFWPGRCGSARWFVQAAFGILRSDYVLLAWETSVFVIFCCLFCEGPILRLIECAGCWTWQARSIQTDQ